MHACYHIVLIIMLIHFGKYIVSLTVLRAHTVPNIEGKYFLM